MTKKNRTSSEFNEKSEYHSILERLPFPYHSLDTGGRILTVNDAWLNSLGYKRDDVLGEKITKFMDEESRPEFEEHFTLFTQHTGTFRGQVELINKNGVPIQFLVDGILETAQGDEPTRTHCFLRDISSTHNAESELQRLSARNSAILGAVPEILMEVDANRFYTWANQAGFDFFGTDVLGRKADVFFIEELKEEITSQVAPLLKGAVESLNILSWQRRCDGEKRLLSWCCRPLRDENGKVSGALS
ncbi:MAG: PAS domain S-box protein, partial [Victivallales bacterium]|nr:PAS domain S-box protein [Victivallales bacterium]